MKVYAELFLYVIKLTLFILTSIKKNNAKEHEIFMNRIRAATDIIKKAIEGKVEALDEESYLSNIEWEESERYKTYKSEVIKILESGSGIEKMKEVKTMGMGERVEGKEEHIIAVLQQILNIEDKAKLISQVMAR